MRIRFFGWVVFAFFSAVSLSVAEEILPFRVKHVTDRVAVFAPGKFAPPASMAVITTDKGLIIIDTGLSRKLTESLLVGIKKEMGRKDVLCVINTHHHFDHTGGNPLFEGVDIIGHDNVGPAIRRAASGAAANIQRVQNRMAQRQDRLNSLAADSTEALTLAESNRFDSMVIEETQGGQIPIPPTKTFNDTLTFEAGGLELKLDSFGRAHTDNDILISVPELGVLFTGDLFHTDSIGVTAGPPPWDVPRWLEVLDEVLKNQNGVKTVVGGHMLLFSREWLDAQHRYIRDLWSAVKKGKDSGQTFETFRSAIPLETTFSFLAPHFDLKARANIDRHLANAQDFWRVGMKPAAGEIDRVIRTDGVESARARFQSLRADGEREFYADERELNALGYRFVQERKMPEAVAVFEMNTDAFPQSWNAWDSLGEGMFFSGDPDKAEIHFNKSLELNPDNQNAKNYLSQIRGSRLDTQGETQEGERFAAGARTDLQGPYLGQTPPGLEPRIFAPGIVSTAGAFEFSIAFTPDGREMYFTRRKNDGGRNTMMVSRWEENGWTAPEEAGFCKGYPSHEPHITPDGKKLYFGCWRQRPGADRAEYGIWVTERTEGGWGEPRYHGEGMYVSSTLTGDLYMTDITNAAGGGLVTYPNRQGSYGPPKKMPDALNAPTPVAHGFIAPDGSSIVFDTYHRPGGQGGEGDLYVSFRKPDGTWSEARNLGDAVNTPATNFCPMVTPDGKYLFFATKQDIYWVSSEVIERLKSEVP